MTLRLAISFLFVGALWAQAPLLGGHSSTETAAAARAMTRGGMSYEVEVAPVAGAPEQQAIEVSRIRGRARDPGGSAIEDVGLGLFTADASHRFITMVVTDADGNFDFGKSVPAGEYRLVIKYPGSCTANVPLTLSRRARHSHIEVTMRFPGLGLCSSARAR